MNNNLAQYAQNPEFSKGRLYESDSLTFRDCFQRDLNRIVHSAAFRRLANKTQVFITGISEHYRSRLTHSLEVAQIGRVVAENLGLNSKLTEILCLAHDLGHPPFGHAGEEVLNSMLTNHGGFDHNAHTLKILTDLEERYFNHNGLNLSWECLEGIVKHNGPIDAKKAHWYISEYNQKHDLALGKFPSLEAQVASISDDIAYNSHDLEDGLRANLFTLDDLKEANILVNIIEKIENQRTHASDEKLVQGIIREMINFLVTDLISNSKKSLLENKISNFDQVQNAGCFIIDLSEQGKYIIENCRKFLYKKMYRSSSVMKMIYKAKIIIKDLFEIYASNPSCLPEKWQEKIEKLPSQKEIIISDYIAGMTDRFAIKEHKEMCDF